MEILSFQFIKSKISSENVKIELKLSQLGFFERVQNVAG